MRCEIGVLNPARDAFVSSLGLDPGKHAACKQVHSKRVVFAGAREGVAGMMADGILMRDRGLSASVTVADCMPIWLLERSAGIFGVLHSGWTGTGILDTALRLIETIGGEAKKVSAILGPRIGPCCYGVPPERAVAFMDEFGPDAAVERNGSWRLDLVAANAGILERAGVEAWSAEGGCTACGEEYGSSRREGRLAFTRMMAVVGEF